jgi:hypothetical protein
MEPLKRHRALATDYATVIGVLGTDPYDRTRQHPRSSSDIPARTRFFSAHSSHFVVFIEQTLRFSSHRSHLLDADCRLSGTPTDRRCRIEAGNDRIGSGTAHHPA